jgi:hypothetical protein
MLPEETGVRLAICCEKSVQLVSSGDLPPLVCPKLGVGHHPNALVERRCLDAKAGNLYHDHPLV